MNKVNKNGINKLFLNFSDCRPVGWDLILMLPQCKET